MAEEFSPTYASTGLLDIQDECEVSDNEAEPAAVSTIRQGRKRVRRKDLRCKKKGLRKNAPESSIAEILTKDCCKKSVHFKLLTRSPTI